MIERRPLAIARLHFRKRPDEPIEIARLEFVGVARQRGGVAHPVIACAALEEIAKGERRQSCVAAGAAAADDDARCVHQSAFCQEFGAVHAVVHIDDAPIELEPIAVFAPESRAAAVVDVKHRNAAAGPELGAEIERARRRRGRPAMTFDEQGRPLIRIADIVGIVRRIEQSKCRLAAGGREFDWLDLGQVAGDPQFSAVEQVGRLFEDAILAGLQVERYDGRRPIRGAAAKHHAIVVSAYRSEFREPRLDRP